jgi:protein-S-isoprenylcysteine O-methyltransferase Ste14
MMQATDFEFRNRWWLFGAVFFAAFIQFAYDHVPLAVRLAGWMQARWGWNEDAALRAILCSAAAVMVLAALMRTWGSAHLGREVVHDAVVHSERLAADGPYRHTRNPLYLGNILMAVAMALVAPRWGAPIILIALPVFCYRLIGREEAHLEAEQGERYREFQRAVPRLWPSWRARIPSSGAQPDWISGLAAEAFFWSFAAGLVLFAVTLKPAFLYAGFALSPLLSWLAGLAVRGREKSSHAGA